IDPNEHVAIGLGRDIMYRKVFLTKCGSLTPSVTIDCFNVAIWTKLLFKLEALLLINPRQPLQRAQERVALQCRRTNIIKDNGWEGIDIANNITQGVQRFHTLA